MVVWTELNDLAMDAVPYGYELQDFLSLVVLTFIVPLFAASRLVTLLVVLLAAFVFDLCFIRTWM